MAKELAVQENAVPAYLKNVTAAPEDNFDSSDVVIPRIKLLQGLSDEIEQYSEAKAGHFWHTGLDKSLGDEIRFVVADRRKKYMLVAPIQDGQGILARSEDARTWDRAGSWQIKIKGVKQPVTWAIETKDVASSGLTQWGSSIPDDEDSPPAATLFYDYLVFLPDYPDMGPAVVSLARSQIKKAKKGLNDKIQLHKANGRPMQALMFSAKSVDETSDGQTYKNWAFTGAGFVQEEELYNTAMEHAGALGTVQIQDEAVSEQNEGKSIDDGQGDF